MILRYALSLSLLTTSFLLIACGKAQPQASQKTVAQYAQHCASCHDTGAANAPKRGDEQSWKKRKRKGDVTLMKSMTEGMVAMPAKGNCEDCSEQDLKLLLDYLSTSKP